MKIKTLNYIEVEGLEHEWAVKIDDCKQEMKPIIPMFIFVHNDINPDIIYVDNTLSDTKPEKIIEGVTGGIAEGYIEVGFWKIKHKQTARVALATKLLEAGI
ncbi:hypothetical protein LNP27_00960 [Flavobacterium galactosidilyticum]|uniref:hypothetical protein n=1 Tax=Flavobacterium galactosidilyticum TaxID=2893886 RepID=UPI001E48E64B|nr:hypothetical protein [Flavobacterium sp. F-340]UFH46629.1 hypothetical protein LNP27_00960 [Flavobacterium sp. F-340]